MRNETPPDIEWSRMKYYLSQQESRDQMKHPGKNWAPDLTFGELKFMMKAFARITSRNQDFLVAILTGHWKLSHNGMTESVLIHGQVSI